MRSCCTASSDCVNSLRMAFSSISMRKVSGNVRKSSAVNIHYIISTTFTLALLANPTTGRPQAGDGRPKACRRFQRQSDATGRSRRCLAARARISPRSRRIRAPTCISDSGIVRGPSLIGCSCSSVMASRTSLTLRLFLFQKFSGFARLRRRSRRKRDGTDARPTTSQPVPGLPRRRRSSARRARDWRGARRGCDGTPFFASPSPVGLNAAALIQLSLPF